MSTDTPKENHYWTIYLVVFILLSTMAVLRYYSLHSTVYDMGLFINNFYMISEGYWERLFLSHIQPLGFFWSLLYEILPTYLVPIFILLGQVLLLTLACHRLISLLRSSTSFCISVIFSSLVQRPV